MVKKFLRNISMLKVAYLGCVFKSVSKCREN